MLSTSTQGTEQVTIEDIRRAAARIGGTARRTPVMRSGSFDRESQVETFFKCENLQRGGAFKFRGASNFLLSIPKPDLARGVVAFSSGNHAQAVAIAAKKVGAKATLVMPLDAPASKVAATRAHGAEIVTYDRLKEDREGIGKRIAAETGATLVPPYDHPWTIAGQGTAALEFLDGIPTLDALVVCIGGGGLIAGCSIAAKALNPNIRIFGVEPELANDTWLSLKRGERVAIGPPETIADGLRSPMPGALTFPIIRHNVESVLLVSEEEIKATMRFLLSRMKILAEPSGAVAAAAVLFRKLPAGLKRAGVILSGGNIDLDLLGSILVEPASAGLR
jgi:threonine dehydratase